MTRVCISLLLLPLTACSDIETAANALGAFIEGPKIAYVVIPDPANFDPPEVVIAAFGDDANGDPRAAELERFSGREGAEPSSGIDVSLSADEAFVVLEYGSVIETRGMIFDTETGDGLTITDNTLIGRFASDCPENDYVTTFRSGTLPNLPFFNDPFLPPVSAEDYRLELAIDENNLGNFVSMNGWIDPVTYLASATVYVFGVTVFHPDGRNLGTFSNGSDTMSISASYEYDAATMSWGKTMYCTAAASPATQPDPPQTRPVSIDAAQGLVVGTVPITDLFDATQQIDERGPVFAVSGPVR